MSCHLLIFPSMRGSQNRTELLSFVVMSISEPIFISIPIRLTILSILAFSLGSIKRIIIQHRILSFFDL
jgi:hypothetical protein